MGYGATPATIRSVTKMIKATIGPWHLLKLPNKQWAALWFAGLDCDHATGIVEGDYWGCAYVGTRRETVEFIVEDLKALNKEDPLNFKFNIAEVREKLAI